MTLAGVVRGHGEPVLLVHGVGLCWQTWEPLFAALEDFEIHAIDLPGFGSSPPLPGPVTLGALLGALEDYLDLRGLERAHLVGNSLGGLLVAGLAARQRALSVTAISPGGLAEGWDRLTSRGSILLSHALARMGREALPTVVDSGIGRHLAMRAGTAARPSAMTRDHAMTIVGNFAGSDAVRRTLDAMDGPGGKFLPYLDDISVPLTVAWGSGDLLLRPRQGARVKRAYPWVRLVLLDGAGHVPMTDAPDDVAWVIRSTIASADRVDTDV